METVVAGRLVHFLDINPSGKKSIVILHGWGHDSTIWADFALRFAPDYRVIIPDLPSFGQSQSLAKNSSLGDYAEWVSSLIQKLQLNRPVLMGHSTGGQIAAFSAGALSLDLSALILIAPALVRYEEKVLPLSLRLSRLLSRLKPYLPKLIVDSLSSASDYAAASPIQKELMKRFIREDVIRFLSNIKVKTLCIWGEFDKETLGEPKKLAHLIPNGRLRIIYNAKHNLMIDSPDHLERNIKHFLRNNL